MITKKKSLQEKSQTKKYSSRINYKLLPQHLRNQACKELKFPHSKVSSSPSSDNVIKICPDFKTAQSHPPISVSVNNANGTASAQLPVIVLQSNEILNLLAATSAMHNDASDNAQITITPTFDHCHKNVDSNLPAIGSEADIPAKAPSPPPTIQTSSLNNPAPANYIISPSSQIIGPSLSSKTTTTIAPTTAISTASAPFQVLTQPQFIQLPQLNSVFQLPIPLKVALSQISGRGGSIPPSMKAQSTNQIPNDNANMIAANVSSTAEHTTISKRMLSPETNVVFSPSAAHVQSSTNSSTNTDNVERSIRTISKDNAFVAQEHHPNKKVVFSSNKSSNGVPTVNADSGIHSISKAHGLFLSPSMITTNASSYLPVSSQTLRRACTLSSGNPSLLFSDSDSQKSIMLVQIPTANLLSNVARSISISAQASGEKTISKPPVTVASNPSANLQTSNPCVVVGVSQNLQTAAHLKKANKVILNVQTTSATGGAGVSHVPSNGTVSQVGAGPFFRKQIIMVNPVVKPNVICTDNQTKLVTSTKSCVSHPNLINLLQNNICKNSKVERRTVMSSSDGSSAETVTRSPILSMSTCPDSNNTLMHHTNRTSVSESVIMKTAAVATGLTVTESSSKTLASPTQFHPSAAHSCDDISSSLTSLFASSPSTCVASNSTTAMDTTVSTLVTSALKSPLLSSSSSSTSSAKSAFSSRVQLTVVTDPFLSKRQTLQNGL